MTIGILFIIWFTVTALVFAAIVVVRILKKEKKQINADTEVNTNGVPSNPRQNYSMVLLVSVSIGLLVAIIVYLIGLT
jgi:ABC-type spermidine/putrescine transport system permease subunit I